MFTFALYFYQLSSCYWHLFPGTKREQRCPSKNHGKLLDNILPQFLSIILVIGITLAMLSPQEINNLIGRQSGWIGMLIAAIIGSVTLIPGFVAFPLTAALYKNGGGLIQLAVFICTLMAVGVVTLPAEIKYFGLKVSIFRNSLAFIYSFIAAILMGVLLS